MRFMARALIAGTALLAAGSSSAQSATVYQYDALGRLVQVQDGRGIKSSYTLDPADNRSNVTVQQQFATSWEAENLPHVIGFADADG